MKQVLYDCPQNHAIIIFAKNERMRSYHIEMTDKAALKLEWLDFDLLQSCIQMLDMLIQLGRLNLTDIKSYSPSLYVHQLRLHDLNLHNGFIACPVRASVCHTIIQ